MKSFPTVDVLMTLTYGFPQSTWDAAKDEAREQLAAIAKKGARPLGYGELAAKIRSIPFDADNDAFHKMLGQISVEEDAAGRGMLSVLVVHKGGDMRPGNGFFELAQQLGRDAKDRDAFWASEMRAVQDAWR
ncbi:MAG: hypothetical protein KIT43_00420 [Bauldia sp.]|nr:hypothetical protein [Bauldia sp.]MCW5718060.1 hypothetical protein [Bauldia sp.]